MLEYSKLILEKVSFDSELFQKELKKALRILNPEEIRELVEWSRAHFSYWLTCADLTGDIYSLNIYQLNEPKDYCCLLINYC